MDPISVILVIDMMIKAIILYILADFWPVVLMGLISIVCIVLICCSWRKKKKRIIIYAAVITVCIIGSVIWCVLFPTAYPYVDLWVLGKTEEEIIEVYGEPDYNESWSDYSELAYYTKYIIFDPDYYIITIDEDGKAIDVREDVFTPKGG